MCLALLPGPLYAFVVLGLDHTLLPEQLLLGTRQWPQIVFLLGLTFLPRLQNSLPEVATEKKNYLFVKFLRTYLGPQHVAVVSKEVCFLPYLWRLEHN
jgi:hypothetical protein